MALNPCGILAKILLAIINVIYVLVGFILVGAGVAVLVEKDEFQVLTGEDNLIVAIGLIVAGIFTVLIAFLGIISSIGEISSLLIVYAFLSAGLICVEVAGAAVCYIERTTITKNADTKFKEYIGKYRDANDDDYNSKVNEVIDVAQSGLHCCGLSGYADWTVYNSEYVLSYGFPSSCTCNKNEDGDKCVRLDLTDDGGVWKRGCNSTFYGLIGSNFTAIGGSGIGVAVIQILTVIIAVSLCLCVTSAKATERRIARIQAAAYTPLEPYSTEQQEQEEANGGMESYHTRTVNNEIEPNDNVSTEDHRMYIK